jgi:hypothetical protein
VANREKIKRRLGKAISRRTKQAEKDRLKESWRNIFIKTGYLK